jgi:hypothetical protein
MDKQTSSKKQKSNSGERVHSTTLQRICPCCKKPKCLLANLTRSHIAVAVCAHKDLVAQFVDAKIGLKDDNCSFKVCCNCYSFAREAVFVVRGQFPAIPVFDKIQTKSTVFKSSFIDTTFDVQDGDILDLVINFFFLHK